MVVACVEESGEEGVAGADGGVDASWVDEDAADEFVVGPDVDDALSAAGGEDVLDVAAVALCECACGVDGLLFGVGGLVGERGEFGLVELGHPYELVAEGGEV